MRKKLLISCSSFRNFTLKPNHLTSVAGSSKFQWRGLSRAACVPEETSDTRRKSRPRIPKHERRAMVESFVNKYRSENAGKFPTINHTQKEVGGSYYVVRDILQELDYKSKTKSLNSTDEILVNKLSDKSRLKPAEPVNVSSGKVKAAKDKPIQDDSQSVLLDDKKAVNTGCELLEEKRGPPTSSWEGGLFNEVETISKIDNHCITSEINIFDKQFKEPSSLQMPNDVKTEEADSNFSDSVTPESQLLEEEAKHFSTSSSENYGAEKRKEQSSLEDMSSETSHYSPLVPNDVKSVEAVSNCTSGYVAPGRHRLKEEVEQISAPTIEKSGNSCSKDQIHDSKFVNIENHPTIEIQSSEKEGFEKKVQDGVSDLPGVDNSKQEKEQSQSSLKSDESKIDSSNKRESSSAVASEKSTLWGNMKSFADGVLNILRKL